MKTEIPEAAIRAGVEALNRASHKIERYIGDDDVRLVQAVLAAAVPHMASVPDGYALMPVNRALGEIKSAFDDTPATPHMLSSVPDGWRPIETAPKDGTEVDLWIQGDGEDQFRVINFSFFHGQWRREGDEALLQLYGRDDLHPTHWRPQPEPPREEVADENH